MIFFLYFLFLKILSRYFLPKNLLLWKADHLFGEFHVFDSNGTENSIDSEGYDPNHGTKWNRQTSSEWKTKVWRTKISFFKNQFHVLFHTIFFCFSNNVASSYLYDCFLCSVWFGSVNQFHSLSTVLTFIPLSSIYGIVYKDWISSYSWCANLVYFDWCTNGMCIELVILFVLKNHSLKKSYSF